jgi:hypothetical protein
VRAIGSSRARNAARIRAQRARRRAQAPSARPRCAQPTGRPITHQQLVASWARALSAAAGALDADEPFFSRDELQHHEQALSAERRWLERFAAIRRFP